MTETKDQPNSIKLSAFVAFVAIIPGILTGYVAYQNSLYDQKLGELKSELQAISDQRKFDIRIYEEVLKSLTSKDDEFRLRHQSAALALVVTIGQEPLRCALLRTFDEAITSDPDVIAMAQNYLKDADEDCDFEGNTTQEVASVEISDAESEVPVQPERQDSQPSNDFDWSSWRIDLFYCESSKSGPQAARVAREALVNRGANAGVRVRPLPDATNARSGYDIEGYVIRRGPDEKEVADELRDVMMQSGSTSGGVVDIQPSSQGTYKYVSAFFCPN